MSLVSTLLKKIPVQEEKGKLAEDASPASPAPLALPVHEPPAVIWLRSKLTPGPRYIAALVCEWCGGQQVPQKDGELQWEGGRDGTHGRWIADLNAARAEIGVQAYINDDGKWWWRLPAAREHRRDLVKVGSLARSMAAIGR